MTHNDDERNEERLADDAKQRERFQKENPDLIVRIMEAGDFDRPNANCMIYPKEVIEKAIEDFNKRIKEKTLVVFDNIDGNSGYNDLMRAGGVVTEISHDGSRINARIKFINTESGERLSHCLKHTPELVRLRTQLGIDNKIVGIHAEDVSRIPFPK